MVGAGHNGLVAACYLARAGLSVEVVERDVVLGGAVSTVERWPGVRADRGSSAHVIVRHSGIVEELDLAGAGLRYVDCDPWGFAPAPRPGDPGPTAGRWCCRSTSTPPAPRSPPPAARTTPPPTAVSSGSGGRAPAPSSGAFGRPPGPASLVRAFWPLGAPAEGRPRTPGGDLAADFLSSGDELLDRWFTSERLKAALAWFGAQSGPPMSEPGTAAMVGWVALLHDVPPGHPVGGSGGLAAALRRRLEADGGRVVLGDGAHACWSRTAGSPACGRRRAGCSARPSSSPPATCWPPASSPGATTPRPPSPTRGRRWATGSASSSGR